MTNNDILRRIRYVFDFGDDKMIALFALADKTVTRAEVSDWLKKEDDPAYRNCGDKALAYFLNGLIVDRRGRREGPAPIVESRLTNNLILQKLKIAMAFSSDDMLEVLHLAGNEMGKHEMSALFRKPGHKHHRKCLDQVLRNFLTGLRMRFRPQAPVVEPSY